MAAEPLSELEVIEIIREMLPEPAPGVVVGPGDDAAVIDLAGARVILTVDAIHQGVHFTLDAYDLADVGWKAITSAVSDVAAMGGDPACALVSAAFGYPPTEDEIRLLLRGVVEASAQCGCHIVGGDVCASSDGLSLTVTVVGTPPEEGPVLRSGAGQGDEIGVTGTLGDSAGGLFVLKGRSDDLRSRFPRLVEVHLRPRPLLAAGKALAAAGVSAMADVSDGLAMDISNICRASKAGCEIAAENVPISEELRALAGEAMLDPLQIALAGGEDYQLLFTAPPATFGRAASALEAIGVAVTRLGAIKEASSGVRLLGPDGRSSDMEGLGYDHFL